MKWGAPSLIVRDNAVSPRVCWESQNDNHIMRTSTSHYLFLNDFIISVLFFIDSMHLLRFSKKHQKHA